MSLGSFLRTCKRGFITGQSKPRPIVRQRPLHVEFLEQRTVPSAAGTTAISLVAVLPSPGTPINLPKVTPSSAPAPDLTTDTPHAFDARPTQTLKRTEMPGQDSGGALADMTNPETVDEVPKIAGLT